MIYHNTLAVGVLGFQGDVVEHVRATEEAAKKLKKHIAVIPVRTRDELKSVDALIIPGGESTTLQKLCEREGMLGEMKKLKAIFGTCAGAILMAKKVAYKAAGQETLELMNIEVDRNAYGRQSESFEETIDTTFGKLHAIFIRAPRITKIEEGVTVLAKKGSEILACEQKSGGRYYLAAAFHPELTSTVFHRHFLKQVDDLRGA